MINFKRRVLNYIKSHLMPGRRMGLSPMRFPSAMKKTAHVKKQQRTPVKQQQRTPLQQMMWAAEQAKKEQARLAEIDNIVNTSKKLRKDENKSAKQLEREAKKSAEQQAYEEHLRPYREAFAKHFSEASVEDFGVIDVLSDEDYTKSLSSWRDTQSILLSDRGHNAALFEMARYIDRRGGKIAFKDKEGNIITLKVGDDYLDVYYWLKNDVILGDNVPEDVKESLGRYAQWTQRFLRESDDEDRWKGYTHAENRDVMMQSVFGDLVKAYGSKYTDFEYRTSFAPKTSLLGR